jgi:pentatricopeptide repeat protein
VNFPPRQARALFDAGDRSGAITVAEAAAKAFPKDSPTQFTLVDLYSDAGRSNDAEKVLRQMMAADPANARVLNHLGYLLATRGDQLDEAVSLVQRALKTNPDQPEYLDSLGWAYFKRGDLNDALKYLSAAAAKLPEHSEIQDHLGDVHFERGALQDAIAAWTRALAGNGQGIEKTAVEKKVGNAKVKMQNAK